MQNMPPVSRCEVEKCFYNREMQCHAPAINVGSDHPECDTFIPQASHIDRKETSMVGACHVTQCKYNAEMMCNASGIVVSYHEDHADCSTFSPR